MDLQLGQIVTQIISFLIMLWILSRFAWKPIMQTIDARKDKIEAEFQHIEDEKKRANDQLLEYKNRLQELNRDAEIRVKAALDDAKIKAQKMQEESHQKSREILLQAQADIQKEIQQAQIQLKKEIVQTVYSATEQVLKKNFDKADEKELLEEISKHVGAN